MASDSAHTYRLALKVSGWEVSLLSPDAGVMQRQMKLWFPAVGEALTPKTQPESSLSFAVPTNHAAVEAPPKKAVKESLFSEPVFTGPLFEAVAPFPTKEAAPTAEVKDTPEVVLESTETEEALAAEEAPPTTRRGAGFVYCGLTDALPTLTFRGSAGR
jgi:hypothetical protein